MSTSTRTQVRHYESLAQAAERVGVSTRTIRRWIANGQLAAYRAGPRLMPVDPDDLDQVLRLIPTADME